METNDLAVVVSAVTLNLLQLFDPAKFQFLLTVYRQRTESLITQRALTGILLALEIDGVIAENPPGVYMALS